jgi:hypothetical protein
MFPTRRRVPVRQPDGRLDCRPGWVERIVGGLPVLERLCTQWREWAGIAGNGLDSRRRVRLHKIKHDCLFRCAHSSLQSTVTPWVQATLSIVNRMGSSLTLSPSTDRFWMLLLQLPTFTLDRSRNTSLSLSTTGWACSVSLLDKKLKMEVP